VGLAAVHEEAQDVLALLAGGVGDGHQPLVAALRACVRICRAMPRLATIFNLFGALEDVPTSFRQPFTAPVFETKTATCLHHALFIATLANHVPILPT
jgi:hypothetical protein